MSRDRTERILRELRRRPHDPDACVDRQVALMEQVADLTAEVERLTGELRSAREHADALQRDDHRSVAERDRAYGLLRWLTRTDRKVRSLLVEISEKEFWLDDVLLDPDDEP